MKAETLQSLYIINKHAKKYAEKGTENYRKGKKTTAKANSNKKEALYRLKEKVLTRLEDKAERIELHEIDGEDFYCFYFDQFSFHTPKENIEVNSQVENERELEEFQKDSEKEIQRTLKDSLKHLQEEFNLNANNFLPQKKLDYGYKRYFIGWKYL